MCISGVGRCHELCEHNATEEFGFDLFICMYREDSMIGLTQLANFVGE
jgi:hypothetical protein